MKMKSVAALAAAHQSPSACPSLGSTARLNVVKSTLLLTFRTLPSHRPTISALCGVEGQKFDPILPPRDRQSVALSTLNCGRMYGGPQQSTVTASPFAASLHLPDGAELALGKAPKYGPFRPEPFWLSDEYHR